MICRRVCRMCSTLGEVAKTESAKNCCAMTMLSSLRAAVRSETGRQCETCGKMRTRTRRPIVAINTRKFRNQFNLTRGETHRRFSPWKLKSTRQVAVYYSSLADSAENWQLGLCSNVEHVALDNSNPASICIWGETVDDRVLFLDYAVQTCRLI
jgi:hypothetical protein